MYCQMNTFLRRDTMTEITDHVYKFVDCMFKTSAVCVCITVAYFFLISGF